MSPVKGVGKPDEGEPHVRIDRGGAGNGAARQAVCGLGRCAGKCHRDGLVGTQLAGHPQPRQFPTRLHTGNAANSFISLDRYVAWQLTRLLINKRGRNLRKPHARIERVMGNLVRYAGTAPLTTNGFGA